MDTINVVIADDNVMTLTLLEHILTTDQSIRIVGKADNGLTALKMIKECKPDVVLLDMIMPQIDGLEVLRRVHADKFVRKMPALIMISAVGTDILMEQAFAEGANYYLIKPFDHNVVLRIVKQYAKEVHDTQAEYNTKANLSVSMTVQSSIKDTLRRMGVPLHIMGYQYLKDAIEITVHDQDAISAVTKVLYPSVAKMHSTTVGRVERAIRHAITRTWELSKEAICQELFDTDKFDHIARPTNAQFIALAADKIRTACDLYL